MEIFKCHRKRERDLDERSNLPRDKRDSRERERGVEEIKPFTRIRREEKKRRGRVENDTSLSAGKEKRGFLEIKVSTSGMRRFNCR